MRLMTHLSSGVRCQVLDISLYSVRSRSKAGVRSCRGSLTEEGCSLYSVPPWSSYVVVLTPSIIVIVTITSEYRRSAVYLIVVASFPLQQQLSGSPF